VIKRLATVDKKGNITGGITHMENNSRGQPVERSEYEWGGRITADGPVNGLVSFPDDSKKKGGSTYFTFRVISKDSPTGSWIRPAVEPVDVIGALEKATRPAVEEMIGSGFESDLGL
jgi:hypothetical protein